MDPVVQERRVEGTPRIAAGSVLSGRYRLTARIGAGGMATIYRARDELLDRDVAVKILHPHLADEEALRDRFRAEARAAAALPHPHVVNVFDSGVARGTPDLPYIVMEHVDGPSLRDILDERGRLSPGQALAVLEPVCAALTRAHRGGLVHRDVKPENVLVTSEGTVKVADFGIARVAADAGTTGSGALLASVHYVAPELVRGDEATPASDQYAVGVLLYELLTGRQALPADSPAAVALRHAREPIPAPSASVPELRPDLDAVVARATALDRGARFGDLGAFVAALRAAVPEGPAPVVVTAAPAPSSGTLVIPRDSLETAALPGSGAHGVAGDAPARRRAGPRRTAPRRAARRAGARALAVAAVVAVVLAGGLALSWNRFLAPPVPVPSLANASRDQAEAALEGMGLQARVAGTATSRTVPREGVVAQDPPPGTELRRGGTVALTLSKGPAIVAMPSVLGLTREEALARLRAEPLALEVQVDESYAAADAPAGRVQAQVPAPDAAIPEGSAAVVNVSLGPEQLPVPDLLGRTRQEAEALLAEARLEGRFSEGYRDDEPRPGRVAEQSVAPGEQVDRGTPIAVVLSRGPASVQVPDLYLRPLDEARQELAELGLEVEVEERPRPRIGPIPLAAVGLVEAQDPPAGTSLQRGGTVRLFTYADRGQG